MRNVRVVADANDDEDDDASETGNVYTVVYQSLMMV